MRKPVEVEWLRQKRAHLQGIAIHVLQQLRAAGDHDYPAWRVQQSLG
jgi:hypothetical protein